MKNKYNIFVAKQFNKQLKQIDYLQRKIIQNWITNKLPVNNPTSQGKALKGDLEGIWRYRLGNYRIICKINSKKLEIFLLKIGHRKDIYK